MEDYIDESILKTINNKYDYSTAIVGTEQFMYIVNYLENIAKNFLDMLAKEEEKNKNLKFELQHFDYKQVYGVGFKINLRNKELGYMNYKDLNVFRQDFNDKKLKNLEYVELVLDLSFKRGIGFELTDYNNKFTICFKPYEIVFTRESDHNVMLMNQLETNIKNMLDQLPLVDTIFCSKGE